MLAPANIAAAAPTPNQATALGFFVGRGLTNFQAAGIVGNLVQESGMNPNAIQAGGRGRGIAQWSVGGRWDRSPGGNVVSYAARRGQSPWSLGLQLEFIWFELTSFPGYGLAPLRASTNLAAATIIFQNRFERCGLCNQAARIRNAQAALGGVPARSVPALSSSYEVALQITSGKLWTLGSKGSKFWTLGMKAGTSPAITTVPRGYEVAFQGNDNSLWTVGSAGNKRWGLGMKAGTSPSITAVRGGFEVAFQGNDSSLYTVGTAGNKRWGLGMRAGTSPSIAAVPGGYQVAFQGNDSSLFTVGAAGNKRWGAGMRAGTSPAITR